MNQNSVMDENYQVLLENAKTTRKDLISKLIWSGVLVILLINLYVCYRARTLALFNPFVYFVLFSALAVTVIVYYQKVLNINKDFKNLEIITFEGIIDGKNENRNWFFTEPTISLSQNQFGVEKFDVEDYEFDDFEIFAKYEFNMSKNGHVLFSHQLIERHKEFQ